MADLTELAAQLGTTPGRLDAVLAQTLARLPRGQYYVFRIASPPGGGAPSSDRPRMVAAFPSPDDALAFAQRNGYGSSAQLRAIAASDLILRMLAEHSIGSILFLFDMQGESRPGFGPGLKIDRAELLAHLQHDEQPEPAQPELSAAQYDALQFGVNFRLRAEFRVALAQAIEQVVDSYEPPEGSLDRGPRSIFATTAVEAWLKEHGFPHAHQRRWISVAGEPGWGGAVELCELEGGTTNRLLIQLLIHLDETGRQYIKHVNVTA